MNAQEVEDHSIVAMLKAKFNPAYPPIYYSDQYLYQ